MTAVYKKHQTKIEESQKKLLTMLEWIVHRYKLHDLIKVSLESEGIRLLHVQEPPVVDIWIVFEAFESEDDHRRKDPCWICVQYKHNGQPMQLGSGYSILQEFDEPHHGPRERFLTNVITEFFGLLIGREISVLKTEVFGSEE